MIDNNLVTIFHIIQVHGLTNNTAYNKEAKEITMRLLSSKQEKDEK